MSVRVWKIDREAILADLARWARELGRQDEDVLAIVLFGSLARGDHTAASDADLLVILRDSSLQFDERLAAFRPSGIGIGVDVFPYTIDEVRRGIEEGWGVARIALEEGIFLFKRKGLPFKGKKTMNKGLQLLFKRMLDVAISLVGLVLLALPFALIALLIKLDSKGPVFFQQERMGLNGRVFRVWKGLKCRTAHEVRHCNEQRPFIASELVLDVDRECVGRKSMGKAISS